MIKNLFLLLFTASILIGCSIKEDEVSTGLPEINVDSLPNHMTPEILWMLGRVSDLQVSPDGTKILYGITYYDIDKNTGNRDLFLLDIDGEIPLRLTETPHSEFNAIWRPDGEKIGYLAPNDSGIVQLWEMNPDGSNKTLMSDFTSDINGFIYSPKQTKILYVSDVKLDQTPTDIHTDLPKANVRIIDDLMYRHWNTWHNYSYSHIFYTDYKEKGIEEGRDIMKDERFDAPMKPYGGMEQITWSPDESKIAYTCKKSSGKEYAISTNSDIYIYDIKKRSTINLTQDGFDGYDHNPLYAPDGKKIVWKSMETPGFEADKERIMMHDFEKNKTIELTEGFDQSSDHFAWNADGTALYFISGIHATKQIYKVDPVTKKIDAITKGHHDYTELVPVNDSLLIGAKMAHDLPIEIFAVDAAGIEQQLTYTNKKILDHLVLARSEERWIETTDGKQMLTWVIYPPNFDSTKQYPALLYCQGGPQSAVSHFFSYRWNFQIMAANDYIIIAPNRRGLPTFGQAWNDQISGDYGGQNMKDLLTAIDVMAKEPFIDANRLGAIGASYGGFSTFWLAGNHENRFKAFISHCGIYNFESMYGATEEYFFVNHDYEGAYWEKPVPKSYSFSPHKYVSNWNTPILIITGANDFRIPYTQSLEAFNAAQLNNVPSRLLF
ncbi:MAG: S9 family peptidase, partial [Bacteroidales bacterium]|nr:S9 family peptidase [Bacteroidales bacterium]